MNNVVAVKVKKTTKSNVYQLYFHLLIKQSIMVAKCLPILYNQIQTCGHQIPYQALQFPKVSFKTIEIPPLNDFEANIKGNILKKL